MGDVPSKETGFVVDNLVLFFKVLLHDLSRKVEPLTQRKVKAFRFSVFKDNSIFFLEASLLALCEPVGLSRGLHLSTYQGPIIDTRLPLNQA